MALMTQYYRDEIIEAAQVAGARAAKDHFCPKWKINQLYKENAISVTMAGDKLYRVTVTDPGTQRSESIEVSVPTAQRL
jgi:hypothetical protein